MSPNPQLLSPEQLAQFPQTVRRSRTTHESNVVHWYQQDVPALLGHIAAVAAAARYVPVGEALPTKLTDAGWSEAVQVCTDGRVNIFPHNYVPAKNGRPGYWIQIGEPHQVKNVTHWREFADDPTPEPVAIVVEVAAEGQPWTLVADDLPPSLEPSPRIPCSAVVEVRMASGHEGRAFHMNCLGGGWRNADTHTPVEGTVVSWRFLQATPSAALALPEHE